MNDSFDLSRQCLEWRFCVFKNLSFFPYRYFKHRLRNLQSICPQRDYGNVCPACPVVIILVHGMKLGKINVLKKGGSNYAVIVNLQASRTNYVQDILQRSRLLSTVHTYNPLHVNALVPAQRVVSTLLHLQYYTSMTLLNIYNILKHSINLNSFGRYAWRTVSYLPTRLVRFL